MKKILSTLMKHTKPVLNSRDRYSSNKPGFLSGVYQPDNSHKRPFLSPNFDILPSKRSSDIEMLDLNLPCASKPCKGGKKKIRLEYITNKIKRSVSFSKRKKGIMKKAFELNVMTGSEMIIIIASETGHVYTYSTPKLKNVLKEQQKNIQDSLVNEIPSDDLRRGFGHFPECDSKRNVENDFNGFYRNENGGH
jgi:SRF-type transcription factor (DNA-binding and dimerisation domain)